MILLDTHVLLWSRLGDARVGPVCERQIERAPLTIATAGIAALAYIVVAISLLGVVILLPSIRR